MAPADDSLVMLGLDPSIQRPGAAGLVWIVVLGLDPRTAIPRSSRGTTMTIRINRKGPFVMSPIDRTLINRSTQ
jgi:hypothetical protein